MLAPPLKNMVMGVAHAMIERGRGRKKKGLPNILLLIEDEDKPKQRNMFSLFI